MRGFFIDSLCCKLAVIDLQQGVMINHKLMFEYNATYDVAVNAECAKLFCYVNLNLCVGVKLPEQLQLIFVF